MSDARRCRSFELAAQHPDSGDLQGGIAPLLDRGNEVLRIEEALGASARYVGGAALPQFRDRAG